MTKEDIKLSLKRVFADRSFLTIAMLLIAAALIYIAVTGLTLQARDVQVYSRYTSFGEAHFYKSPWQHLISYVVFGVVVAATHLALMVKFHNLERRGAAMLIGYAGVAVLFIAFMYSIFIMHLAFR